MLIPVSNLSEGFEESRILCHRHLNQAKFLLEGDHVEGSIILTVFGLEELGRMKYIKDRYKQAIVNNEKEIKIPDYGEDNRHTWYNHKKKQHYARKVLSEESLRVFIGNFKKNDFSEEFRRDKHLSQDLREKVTYLRYLESHGYWASREKINAELLKKTIAEIERICETLEFKK